MDKPSHLHAYSIDEVAALLAISRRHLHRLLERGALRSVRLGRRRVIPGGALEELLGERPPQPRAPRDVA